MSGGKTYTFAGEDLLIDILPSTRKAAKAIGSRFYFTGLTCTNGHTTPRLVKGKKCCDCNRMWGAKAHAKNRDHANARRRQWNLDNAESVKEKRKAAYWAAPEKARAAVLQWGKENPEKVRHQARIKRARKRSFGGSHTLEEVMEIRKMQKDKCAYCRISLKCVEVHIDHIVPVSKGGHDGRSNLQATCINCNLSKKAMDPVDYARRIGRLI